MINKAADMYSFNKGDFQTMPPVSFYHVCFYHLITNEANVDICSYSLATFHNAYLMLI